MCEFIDVYDIGGIHCVLEQWFIDHLDQVILDSALKYWFSTWINHTCMQYWYKAIVATVMAYRHQP